MKVNILLKKTY